ncbi:MAG: SurA N-terminal domain-containing protein [Parvularculaceae bacterium]
MLKQVRGALHKGVAWVGVILLVAAFGMWGVPEIRTLAGNTALKVGSESFSQTYISREFDRMFQARARESGGSLTREAAVASGMPNQVIETVTNQSVIEQYVSSLGLAAPRSAVRDYLQANEAFQNPGTGKFDRLVLDAILQNNNLTVTQFEKLIRDDLLRSQLIDALAAAGPATEPFGNAMILRETERRRIAYLTVTDEMAGKPEEPTPDALQAYYDENHEAFTAPEYRTFDLLTLRNEDFLKDADVSEEELRKIYDNAKDRLYNKPERRTLYQIRFDTEAEANAAAASLRQGEPFENLAQKQGLTLANVTQTEIVGGAIADPTVRDAAFAEGLQPGAIVDPVHGIFGWTVTQVVAILPPETTSYEEVRDEIAEQYSQQDVRRKLQDALDKIEEVRDTGANLAEAAEETGFTVETYGPVDRVSFALGGAIVDKVPGEALREAFLLEEGEQSEATALTDNAGYFIVGLREITPPALKPFEDVRDEVETRWRDQERRRRISAAVRDIRQAVESGETFETVADRYGRAPLEQIIDRRFASEVISPSMNEQIFSADLNNLVSSPAGSAGAQVIAQIREIGYAPEQAVAGSRSSASVSSSAISSIRNSSRRLSLKSATTTASREPRADRRVVRRRAVTTVSLRPDFNAFERAYGEGRAQLVQRTLVNDLETPVSAYLKLAAAKKNAFLLESVEGGEQFGRFSIIGYKPDVIWRCRGDASEINTNAAADVSAFKNNRARRSTI